MAERTRITAIVGSYRKGGVIDRLVDETLASAAEEGAEVGKIYLLDTQIEFCTNCRVCTQEEGTVRGICPIVDRMAWVLDEIEGSDGVVIASPVNFGTMTALMKRFLERLMCYAYWPWGAAAPRVRDRRMPRRAVIVTSSAAPALLARLMTPILKPLKLAATLVGAKTSGVLFVGLAAREKGQEPGARAMKKARLLGKKLAR